MAQHILSAPARTSGRTVTARRWFVSVLHAAAEATGGLSLVAAGILVAASMFGFGPQWMQLTTTADLILALLALYGTAHLAGLLLTGLADQCDPDLRDGRDLHEASHLINQVWHDMSNGADRDDILRELHLAAVPVQFAGLLDELAAGETEETTVVLLWETSGHLRAAAQALAPRR